MIRAEKISKKSKTIVDQEMEWSYWNMVPSVGKGYREVRLRFILYFTPLHKF